MGILIRQAEANDASVVCTFNRLLALESESKDLDSAFLELGVRAVLADPNKGRYFLAQFGSEIVGQLGITFEWSDWRNGWFWWIQSVYVEPQARRQGVFRALFQHVEETARTDPSVIGIRLYVERENHAAHDTYKNMGMDWTTYQVMEKYPL
jgi:GNAT superfamily N-acetyltransferase